MILVPAVAVLLIAALVVSLGFVFGWWDDNPNKDFKVTHHATIKIKDYGTLHVELYGEEAPITVENFVALANKGFYDDLTFHRIMDGFMAQGGCPYGTGTGDSGKDIKGEFIANGVQNDVKHVRGTISMARGNSPDSDSSQFFIVHKTSENNTKSLDGNYAAFGMVTDGMEIIDKMIADTVAKGYTESVSKADQPIIESIEIHAAH
jgi:peptidyl-prolyl cis-trans isomerase B (cyclophilin B)